MGKVSIGLLGWRFDESEVFDDDGEFLALEAMPPEVRQRLVRLGMVYNAPCNACWLIHGDENLDACNTARYVYGEALSEVILCEEHEPDFVYWYREDGGDAHRGSEEFQDAFFEWFLDGGRAPEEYEGMEYVESDPENLPKPPRPEADEMDALMDEETFDEVGFGDVDLSVDYPKRE